MKHYKKKKWFVFIDVWREKQRKKIFSIPQFWQWVLISFAITWFIIFFILAAYIYVSDVGDAIAIFDGYVVLVPVIGLCFPTGEDWKHRYFVSLFFCLLGIVFFAQPGFIFGYSSDLDTQDQLIGCMLSLAASVFNAFATITWVMVKKVAYLDLLNQQKEAFVGNDDSSGITTVGDDDDDSDMNSVRIHNDVDEPDETEAVPLKDNDALKIKNNSTSASVSATASPSASRSSQRSGKFSTAKKNKKNKKKTTRINKTTQNRAKRGKTNNEQRTQIKLN